MARLAALCVLMVACYLSLQNNMGEATTVFVHNQCSFTVCAKFWVPNNGVGGGCSQLGPGGTWTVAGVSPSWVAGTMWAITNTGCAGQACNTRPPGVTQFEITVRGGGNNDYYDLSTIAGYNVGMKVVPTNDNCPSADCRGQDASSCPTGFYPRSPDATKGCATGTADYNLYLCP